MSKEGVASRTPGTCGGRLWLLPSGPDQVHHHAMRGGPPLFVTVRAYMRTHYLRMMPARQVTCCAQWHRGDAGRRIRTWHRGEAIIAPSASSIGPRLPRAS